MVTLLAACDPEVPASCPPGDGLGAWSPLPTRLAPGHRHHHVMTNSAGRVLVWGGQGDLGPLSDGALYDVVSETWSPLPDLGAPSPRWQFAWAFSGRFLVVWGGLGGLDGDAPRGDGAVLDTFTGTWTTLPAEGAPSPRYRAAAAMSGQEFFVVGGLDQQGPVHDGHRLDLAATPPTWTAMTGVFPLLTEDDLGPRGGRAVHLWATADRLLAVSGLGDGGPTVRAASYPFPAGPWLADDASGAPPARRGSAAVWRGSQVILYGGHLCDREPGLDRTAYLDGGGIYTLAGYPLPHPNGWEPLAGVGDVSLPRSLHAAAWTGNGVLVAGGVDPGLCGGAVFLDWTSRQWLRLSYANSPPVAAFPGVAWLGESLVVWGGHRPPAQAPLGPAGNIWRP
jgi:hypothetical protein